MNKYRVETEVPTFKPEYRVYIFDDEELEDFLSCYYQHAETVLSITQTKSYVQIESELETYRAFGEKDPNDEGVKGYIDALEWVLDEQAD